MLDVSRIHRLPVGATGRSPLQTRGSAATRYRLRVVGLHNIQSPSICAKLDAFTAGGSL